MTKHLRIMLLALLTLVCHAVQAEETVLATLSFPDGNSQSVSNYTSTWSATIDDYTWTIVNFNNNGNGWSSIKCGRKNVASIATIGTTNMATAVTKVVVNYGTIKTPEKINSVKLIVASDDAFKNVVETLTADKLATTTKTSEFVITSPKENQYYQLVFDCASASSNGIIEVKTVDYYHNAAADKTSTKTTFGADYDGKTFNFVNGVLEGFSAPKATCTTAGSMAYTSSDEAIVKVDANGQLNFTNTKFGEARITAKFTPTDAATYAGSSASYTVVNTTLYTSLADLKKAMTATEADFSLKLTDAVVTYVNGMNAYMQDATAGVLVYVNGHGLAAGDKLNGTVAIKGKLYNNLAEITAWTAGDNLTKTTGTTIETKTVTLAELTGDNYAKYESMRVKVENVTVTAAMNNRNATIAQNGTTMAVRAGSQDITLEQDNVVDITGYPGIYGTTKQLNVWLQSDISANKDTRKEAQIGFSEESYTADATQSTFQSPLNNPNHLTVAYSIDPAEGASVDAAGLVTYATGVETTYIVTATFAGNTEFLPATASYTLHVVNPSHVIKTIELVAGQDLGTGTGTGANSVEKDMVRIQSTSAAYGRTDQYRFYGTNTDHVFSTRLGVITSIEIEGNYSSYPLDNLSLAEDEPGTFSATKTSATWTGEAKSVTLNAKAQARASKITIIVKMVQPKNFTLSETSDLSTIEAWGNANVTLTRTFDSSKTWETIALPFGMSAAQVADAFGNATLREVDQEACQDKTLAFKPATEIEAGKPYLIKMEDGFSKDNFVINGVALEPESLQTLTLANGMVFGSLFKPTQVSTLASSEQYEGMINNSEKLEAVSTTATTNACRAYLLVPSTLTAAEATIVMDSTDGINDITAPATRHDNRIYNLNGQYVGTNLEGLASGVYIQNGKKVIKK